MEGIGMVPKIPTTSAFRVSLADPSGSNKLTTASLMRPITLECGFGMARCNNWPPGYDSVFRYELYL